MTATFSEDSQYALDILFDYEGDLWASLTEDGTDLSALGLPAMETYEIRVAGTYEDNLAPSGPGDLLTARPLPTWVSCLVMPSPAGRSTGFGPMVTVGELHLVRGGVHNPLDGQPGAT